MSNKTSDNIATEADINELKSIMNLRTDSGFAYSQKNTLELQKSIRNVLAEREQKDKRIQELEEENAMLRKSNNIAKDVNIEDVTEVMNKSCEEFMSDYIPKQVVKDKIKEVKRLRDRCITAEGYNIANGEFIVLQELLEGEK